MSSEDLLYTNKFISTEISNNSTNHDKSTFRRVYEKYFGRPSDLLTDEVDKDHILNDLLNSNKLPADLQKSQQIVPTNVNKSTYRKERVQIVAIDSKDRDTAVYANPNKYRIYFREKFLNIKKVRLVSTEFPNTEQVIRTQPIAKKNNKIYWKNFPDGDDVSTDRTIYSITITDGNYSASKFAKELETKMNSVERAATAGDSAGKLHNFTISVNTTTNIFELKQNDSFSLSQPFSSTKDSKVITVKHNSHNFDTGQLINISGSTKVGGISSSIFNASHLVTVTTTPIDAIIWNSTDNVLRIISGTVDYATSVSGTLNITKGSPNVTGINTTFTLDSNIAQKKVIHIGNYDYIIKSVNNNTSLTLETNALESYDANIELDSISVISASTIRLSMKRVPSGLTTSTLISLYNYNSITGLVGQFNPSSVDDDKTYIEIPYSSGVAETTTSAYFTYSTSATDNSASYNLSKRMIGYGSTTASSSTLSGTVDRYSQEITYNPTNSLKVSSSGYLSTETLTGNITGATSQVYISPTSTSTIYNSSPLYLYNPSTSYSVSVDSSTISSPLSYTVTVDNVTYPGNVTKSRYFINTGSTLTGGTGITNIFEAPKLELITDYTYNITLTGIDNTEFKFSLTDNGTHNSGTELSNASITYDSGAYTIVVNSTLTDAITANSSGEKFLYYYSTSSSDRASGGYFKIVSTASSYDGAKDYGSSADYSKYYYYINGKILGFKDGASDGYTGKTILYTPKHGLSADVLYVVSTSNNSIIFTENGSDTNLTASLTVGNYNTTNFLALIKSSMEAATTNSFTYTATISSYTQKITISCSGNFKLKGALTSFTASTLTGFTTTNSSESTSHEADENNLKNRIAINSSTTTSRPTTNGYGYGTITKIEADGTNIKFYTANPSLVSGDTIVVKGTNSTYDGAYKVDSIYNVIDDTTDYIQVASTINNGTVTYSSSYPFWRGTGYDNGVANSYYYEIVDIPDLDHIVINYSYNGSEYASWSEYITGSESSIITYPTGKSDFVQFGTNFLTTISMNDTVQIGTTLYTIRSVSSNILATLTTSASETVNEGVMYKNITAHGLTTSDQVRFMKSETSLSTDFTGTHTITKVNDIEVTTTDNTTTPSNLVRTDLLYERSHIDITHWKNDSKYTISVGTAATETVSNKGGDSVSIGTEVKFSLLFSYTDTPGNLLGFPNVGTSTGNTSYNSVQSNTTKTNEIDIIESQDGGSTPASVGILATSISGSSTQTSYTRIVTSSAHGMATGDKVYIEDHTNSGNNIAINTNEGHTIIGETATSFFIAVPISQTSTTSGSTNGKMYQKQLYKPFTLSGSNYVFLKIPSLSSVGVTANNIENVFAKILLDAAPGSVLFNTYVSSDKIFEDAPLHELSYLDVEVVDPLGELFEFNNTDHSFSIEITSMIDTVKGSNLSSRTGQIDE